MGGEVLVYQQRRQHFFTYTNLRTGERFRDTEFFDRLFKSMQQSSQDERWEWPNELLFTDADEATRFLDNNPGSDCFVMEQTKDLSPTAEPLAEKVWRAAMLGYYKILRTQGIGERTPGFSHELVTTSDAYAESFMTCLRTRQRSGATVALSSVETTIFAEFLGECGGQFLPSVAEQIYTLSVPSSSMLSYRAVEELRRNRFRDAFREYLHHVATADATRDAINQKVIQDLAHFLREVEPNATMTAAYGLLGTIFDSLGVIGTLLDIREEHKREREWGWAFFLGRAIGHATKGAGSNPR